MNSLLCNLKLTTCTRFKILRCNFEPLPLCSCETWTLMTADKIKITATEVRFLRRMLKVKWTDKVSNAEVLDRAGKRNWIMKTLAKRQTTFLGLVLRKENLEHVVTTEKIIFGKRSKGRQPSRVTD